MKKSSTVLRITIILIFSACFFNNKGYSQTCPTCPSNLSFDTGDWSNWTTSNGNYVFTLPTPVNNPNYSYVASGPGGATPRFEITSGTGFDPNITTLPVVAPCGGAHSARIGCTCGSEATNGAMPYAEWATYTLNVTAANAGFTYMYAAVLEDGTHDKFTQPQFEVIMTKCSDGSLLPCGQYAIYAGSGSAQFIQGPGKLQYTNWTSVSTDLTNYIGQQVCITFRVRDCMGNLSSSNGNYTAVSGGGHRGYAYFDTYCTPVQFTNPEFCAGASTLQICAPPGYKTYSWPSGQPGLSGTPTTQCVTVNNPVSGTTYTVNMTSNGGCPVTLNVPIKGIPVTKSSTNVSVCPGEATPLTVSATGTNGPYTYSWSHGLGTGTAVTVSPTVATTYTVTVKNAQGCTSDELFYVNMKVCGPTITATGGVICSGGCYNITTTAAGGTTPYTYSWNTGATTSALSVCPTSSTTYTVTVKDNTNATASATAAVTVNPNPVVSVPPATICEGNSTTLTASGATTYTWSPATGLSSSTGTSVTANPVTPTTYTVVGSFATGCTGVTTVVVSVNPKPTVTVPPATICQGNSTTLTASGSTTYTWAPATGLSTTTGASVNANPGSTITYTVTGSHPSGCTASATVTVTVNPPCGPGVSATGMTVCNGVCGSVTSTATGGTPPYTYSWNTGETTSGMTPAVCPTVTTTYTVTVTDNSAPVGTATAIAVITVNPIPVITVADATICNGSSATLAASGATTYTWSPATGLSSTTGASVTANPTTSTTYTVCGSSLDCSACTTVAVTVNPIPVVTVPNASICPGGSTVLNASGATSYTWSPSTGISPTTGASVTANPAASTTYTICGTSLGCSSCTTASVFVGALVADAGPDKFICTGGSTTLNASGGTIFTWTPATGLSNTAISNPTATPSVTTTYTVTVSDGSCSDDDVVIVVVDPPVVLNAGGVDVTCFGACNGQIIVIPSGGTSPYTYAWSGGCTAAACSNICAGTYSLIATDALGCTASASATVNQPTALTAALTGSTNVSCFGVCDGTAGVSAAGGTTPYTYAWSPAGGNAANATALCAGSYTCTVTDANSCTVKVLVTITQPTAIIVSSAGGSICPNQSITLNTSATGGTGPYTFAWSPAASLNPATGTSVTASPAVTTPYTITCTDNKGCSSGTTITVTVNPSPVVTIPAATICQGTTTNLSASGANSYSWLPVTGLSNPAIANPVASPTVTTTYTVTGTSSFGCTSTTEVVVTVNIAPVITSTPASICPAEDTTITASGAATYSWTPSASLSSGTGASVTARPKVTTTYTIIGTGTNGCTSSTTVVVTVNPKPVADFSTSPDVVDTFNPTIYFNDQSKGGIINSWKWNFGDPNNSTSPAQNPYFVYPDTSSKYTVQLIVSNQFGCIDTVTGTVYIRGIFTFYIPNTFTPNNDGINDGFMAKGVGIDETDYDLWIFDRWGNLIWHTETWGEAWDGKANKGEKIAQIDTYVWKVHVREKESGIKHNYIGHVNIVK